MTNHYFNLIGKVWQYGAKWRYTVIGCYVSFIIAQAVLSFSPYAFGKAIDVLQHFTPARLIEIIIWLLVGVIALLVFWILHGPTRVIERILGQNIKQQFLLNLYQQLTRMPLKWHQNHHSGNIITRINRAAEALHRFAENQFIYIEDLVKFIASIGFLLYISPMIGIISIVTSFMIMLTVILFDRKLTPLYDAENEVGNHVGAVMFDYISNMTTVLTLRLGELTHTNLFKRIIAIWPYLRKEAILNEVKWFSMMMLFSIVQSAILIGYIIHSIKVNGSIMIGLVVMIFRYQMELNSIFQNFSMHYGDLVRMDTNINSVQPILDDIKLLAHTLPGEVTARQWHTIEINALNFHYADRSQIFNNLNFKIKRGEKIALIGSSGGGKSTLLNLLCGLYTPLSVNLKIDEVEFDTLEPLQAITTLVPQDPEIFENTLEFNITLDLEVDPAEIQRAIKLAGFTNVLATLPAGLATDIREKGVNLSVGQKQRLALARGLFAARFSSLILMDEPTSSVDLPTEQQILSEVIAAFPDAAIIVSLHRLHLLPKFDTVIMLSKGEVIASGVVEELLNNPGPVYELWLAISKTKVV